MTPFPTVFGSSCEGLQRGGGPDPAQAPGNGSIASDRALGPEIARGSPHGPTPVRDAPESGRRSVRRKDFLRSDPRLSVVSDGRLGGGSLFGPTASVSADSPSHTVCSTTLWVGQVDKKATQQDLTNLFEEFGQIESINVSKGDDDGGLSGRNHQSVIV